MKPCIAFHVKTNKLPKFLSKCSSPLAIKVPRREGCLRREDPEILEEEDDDDEELEELLVVSCDAGSILEYLCPINIQFLSLDTNFYVI